MRTKVLALATLCAMLAAGTVYAQLRISANIPFAFHVGKATLPAGQYSFAPMADETVIVISASKTNTRDADAGVITRMAATMHTTPEDSHLVFDKVGDVYTLSEVWLPERDGFLLYSTKGPHEHRVINVPK